MNKQITPETKRINIDIDANLWHQVGILAAQTQQTKRELTESALRHWVKILKKKAPAEPAPTFGHTLAPK